MRLIALLPDIFVMARPVAQIAAIALCLGGCGLLETLSSGPTATGYYYPDPTKVYLTDTRPVTARTELLDRYACLSGAPPVCARTGRLSSTTDCRC